MKTLLSKKLTVDFTTVLLLAIASVNAQIPDRLKNLPPFKLRTSILSSLNKPATPEKLNTMRCSNNSPCLKKQTTLGGSGDDFAGKLIPTRDGGFLVCGGTNSTDGDFAV